MVATRSWTPWVALGVVIVGSIALRTTGLNWLVGVGPADDFSYYLDDRRFVDLSKDIAAGMPDGYVYGMTTHVLWLRGLLSPLLPTANVLQLLRLTTIFYAALTLWLTFAFVRKWGLSDFTAVMGAFFLGVAPVHLVLSNYGTADVAAVFYSYATLYAAILYLQTRSQRWYVLACALTGAAIALKLFLSLLVPLFLLIIVHRGRRLAIQALVAAGVSLFSFELFSFFEYGVADLQTLIGVLHSDVVAIAGGNGPVKQFVLYAWELGSALSLPVSILLFVYLAMLAVRSRKWLPEALQGLSLLKDWRELITPRTVVFSAFAAHAFLILAAGAHASRHLLIFLPLMCIAAAHGLWLVLERMPRNARLVKTVVVGALVIYGTGNALAVERLYLTDVRVDMAAWVRSVLSSGKPVLAMSDWTQVRGTTFDRRANPRTIEKAVYLLICDLEYQGYLRSRDATVYAPYGGQERTDFYWELLEGRSKFHVTKVFRHGPLSFEQRLIDEQILRPIGTFTPKTCLALSNDVKDPAVSQPQLQPRLYYSAGW